MTFPMFPWKVVPCQPSFHSPELRADPQESLGTKLAIQIQMLDIHSSDSNADLEYREDRIKLRADMILYGCSCRPTRQKTEGDDRQRNWL